MFLSGEEDYAARGFRDLLQGRRHRRVRAGGSGSVQRAHTPAVFAADRRTSPAERDLLHGRLGIHEPYASVLTSYLQEQQSLNGVGFLLLLLVHT